MAEDEQPYDQLFKCLIIGDPNVGKTSLLLRFTTSTWTPGEGEASLSGVDEKSRVVKSNKSGTTYKLRVWDTAGQEKFRTITSTFYRGAQAVVVVYDIADSSTFKNVPNWMSSVTAYCRDVGVILVGNKTDLESQRQVPREQGEEYARKNNMEFAETSIHDLVRFP
eukprot:TRINITY_DN1520_c0_g1_i2.p1 TRINITY_DN1520_c0_g1~~TRINITY_DN1520_c0_g1_i2.p1  ORF type:complete len:166 (-),score=47.11 TRINITY_DN1520_c0_g1_i2:293-790(-)